MRAARVYTIGVYGSDRRTFFDALEGAGVDVLLDIRRRRAVRGSRYAFANAHRLIAELQVRGIAYRHELGLAPERSLLALQHAADADAKLRGSQRTALAPEYVSRYRTILDGFDFARLADELRESRAPVLFCIERIPAACHRSLAAPKVAEALGGRTIVDLIPDGAD